MTFELTYDTMFDPLEGLHTRYEAALEAIRPTWAGNILTGGKTLNEDYSQGYFCQPTIVADISLEHKLWNQEMFLPTTMVHRVENLAIVIVCSAICMSKSIPSLIDFPGLLSRQRWEKRTLLVSPIWFMIAHMLTRIGVFFLLVGLLLVFIPIASGNLNAQSLTLLCPSLAFVLFGGTLWYRNRDTTPADRFRILRRKKTKEKEDQN